MDKKPTFPLPFTTNPKPANKLADCRRADKEPMPIMLFVPLAAMLEILRMRIRTERRELGTIPKGYELN